MAGVNRIVSYYCSNAEQNYLKIVLLQNDSR